MFEPDSSKFTSKPDPKREFITYLKETGASAALQKAMTLLYKMPVKPQNLVEYFSEYFQNGAQRLMRVSLLQAEVCYKRDELEKQLIKEEAMENRIKELIETLGISESEFEEKYMPEEMKRQNRLSVLERYFNDIEMNSNIQRSGTADVSVPHVSAQASEQPTTPATLRSVDDLDYDEKNDCRRVKSFQAMIEDAKELDPWGIICKAPGKKPTGGANNAPSHHHHHHHHKQTGSDSQAQDDEFYEADEDDATLAEVFNQVANDTLDVEQDEVTAKLHNQLLMVRKANKAKMADFLGWSPLQSRQDLRTRSSSETTMINSPNGDIPEISIEADKDADIQRRRPLPCDEGVLQDRQSMEMAPSQYTDSFLFDDDEDVELVYKMLEAEHAQEHFDFEFRQHPKTGSKASKKKQEVCVPQCDVSDAAIICANQKLLEEKLKQQKAECPYCGADEKCECPDSTGQIQSMGFIPGKMINWTHQYKEYPCQSATEYSDYPIPGEGTVPTSRSGPQCTSRSDKPDIPLARIDSSCHCLAAAYTADEILGEKEEESDNRRYVRKISLEAPSDDDLKPGEEHDGKKDEAVLTVENGLDNELDEVFKQKRKSSVRKSLTKKAEKKKQDETILEDEIVTQTIRSDVYESDLASNVRRSILGI